MNYFSNNVKYLREQKKLSQNKLAELTNVNQTTIARWENEEITPSLANVLDLADVLNVTVADLTGKDLAKESNTYDETDLLFDKYKDVLSKSDKNIIKAIIEERKRQIDKELNEDN